MTQVFNKLVTPDDNKNYPTSVLAENVILDEDTGLTLKDFYEYLKDYFKNGAFAVFDPNAPVQNNTKFWYKED